MKKKYKLFFSKSNKTALLTTLIAFGVAGISCSTKITDGSPKRVLESYISETFSAKETADKSRLLGYLSGSAYDRLSSWSDDQFREQIIDKKRKFRSLSIKSERSVSSSERQITYELIFSTESTSPKNPNDASPTTITQRKIVSFTMDKNGTWKISEVKSLKETIEFSQEWSLP